jgi:hypothetical protein
VLCGQAGPVHVDDTRLWRMRNIVCNYVSDASPLID